MSIFTIGYQGLPLSEFQHILQEKKIDVLVDVRSKPNGRAFQYNRKALEAMLPGLGVEYVYKGDVLGGFTPVTPDGLKWLSGLIHQQKNFLILCFEADTRECHRHYVLARHLSAQDIEVTHLFKDGREIYESDLGKGA